MRRKGTADTDNASFSFFILQANSEVMEARGAWRPGEGMTRVGCDPDGHVFSRTVSVFTASTRPLQVLDGQFSFGVLFLVLRL